MSRQYDPKKHHRRSIRLKGWDYASEGLYFVTICTHNRQNLFANPKLYEIATQAWEYIPQQEHAQHVVLDESILMSDHIHGIIGLTTPEDAPAFRTLLDGGAEVAIHHAPERGQVRLRYGYDAPASVRIHLAGDDASLATGTAQAGEVVVDLTAALERAREAGLATEPLRLDVRADRPVQVERISLDVDAP